jgi:inosose dehydratase
MNLRIATGPVSWGVDFVDDPTNPPWSVVLDEIAAAGYKWTELGPLGYMPEEPGELISELSKRGLHASGSFVFEPLHEGPGSSNVIAVARRTCELIARVGGSYLVIIDRVSDQRAHTAGRATEAPRLDRGEWSDFIAAITQVAEVAILNGLRPVLHPHVGSYLEFEDEIEEMLDAVGASLIGLCLDTGHSAYAGIDPVDLYRRHADRVTYIHLKDIDAATHRNVIARRIGFWEAIDEGIFCPLGSGLVDFESLASALQDEEFDGWATIEQDRDPTLSSRALDDAIKSRHFLSSIGLVDFNAQSGEGIH